MLSAKRDHQAAKRFFKKVLKARHNKQPRVINIDKNAADSIAVEELKQEQLLSIDCELRQKKYLNNIIEQDHRFPKKLAKYKSYFQFFYTAWRTLRGYAIMNAIRKGQIQNIASCDILGQRDFERLVIYRLFLSV